MSKNSEDNEIWNNYDLCSSTTVNQQRNHLQSLKMGNPSVLYSLSLILQPYIFSPQSCATPNSLALRIVSDVSLTTNRILRQNFFILYARYIGL